MSDGIVMRVDARWEEAARFFHGASGEISKAIAKGQAEEARFLQRKVKQGLRTQAPGGKRFEPLSPLTLAVRKFQGFGGKKALIVRGDLRNSIKVKKGRDGWFVGVLRTAKSRDGEKMVNIAEVQEFGSGPIVMEVTKAMRGFLAAAFTAAFGGITAGGGGFSTGIIVTRVPARPFLRPVFEKYGKGDEMKRRFLIRVEKALIKRKATFASFLR